MRSEREPLDTHELNQWVGAGYGEINARMEWIKYSVHTLNNVNGSLVQQGD
jgi:hypothetical protein